MTSGADLPAVHTGGRARTDLRDLGPRVGSGVVLVAAAAASTYAGGDLFILFWLVAALLVSWEWQRLVNAPSFRMRVLIGSIALTAAAAFNRQYAFEGVAVVLAAGCAVLAWIAGPGQRLWSAAGLLYAAALVLSVSILQMSLLNGSQAIVWLFAVVWTTDIMAYFGGRLIGGPKLWPRVSPSKTWAGFLVGIVSGGLCGVLALSVYPPDQWGSRAAVLVLGVLAAALAQGGDLFESVMKRRFGVKDSSALIPGHGGLMDRLDGFLAAASAAALLGVLRLGPGQAAIGLLLW